MHVTAVRLIWILGLLMGCGLTEKPPAESIYFKDSCDSLNMVSLLGKGQKLISLKIRNNKALIVSTKEAEDHPILSLIDILKKKIIVSQEVKSLKYYEVLSDFDEYQIIYCSVYNANNLFFYNFNKGIQTSHSYSLSRRVDAGDIISKNNQLYYLKGVYGTTFLDLKEDTLHFYQNGRVVNPLSSNISLPIDSGLTLISGNSFAGDSIKLHAVDASGGEKWTYNVIYRQSSQIPIQMINWDSSFIIKTGNDLIKLNKKNGNEVGSKQFNTEINSIFRLDNELIVYSVNSPKNIHEESVNIKSIDFTSLSIKWSRDFDVVGAPQFGIIDKYLFLNDKDSTWKINAVTSSVVDHSSIGKNYINMLTDLNTGKNYLVLNNGILIW